MWRPSDLGNCKQMRGGGREVRCGGKRAVSWKMDWMLILSSIE